MSFPTPPEDESWGIWHRASSEQVLTVVSGQTPDPGPTLARALDFANRAMAKATPLEALLTESLIAAIVKIRLVLAHPEIIGDSDGKRAGVERDSG